MTNFDKISQFKRLSTDIFLTLEAHCEILEKCEAIKRNYSDYLTTEPIDCEKELLRLPTADFDLCCALLTMLIREDHFANGSFELRKRNGQVKMILDRMGMLLEASVSSDVKGFSEKAALALGGFYVYALLDPETDKVFYIGKGMGNRVFSHEIESGKSKESEKKKLKKIREIEEKGLSVKRLIVNWGLTENEAFVAEATLINLLNRMPDIKLTNEVSGHHVHESLTTEEFELLYGAVPLKKEDVKHSILVIKINKLYRRGMSEEEIYDSVRGFWNASLKTINEKQIKYVFGVYNGLIVGVYKPDAWHYGYEMIDAPQRDMLDAEAYERLKNRVYFVCNDFRALDEEGKCYLHKSITNLKVNQSAQNPITYLVP